jgi:hypothetical protein
LLSLLYYQFGWRQNKIRAFFRGDLFEKITAQTIESFLSNITLRFPVAHSAGYSPTEPAAIGTVVNHVILTRDGRWAFPEFISFGTARLPFTFHHFPAVFFRSHNCFSSAQ